MCYKERGKYYLELKCVFIYNENRNIQYFLHSEIDFLRIHVQAFFRGDQKVFCNIN